MYDPTYTACDVCQLLLDRLHTYMGRVMCGTCLMEITMADNTMPDIPKDPEAWSDKDYEDHDELLATLRLYGADIPKDSEMSDNLVGVHMFTLTPARKRMIIRTALVFLLILC